MFNLYYLIVYTLQKNREGRTPHQTEWRTCSEHKCYKRIEGAFVVGKDNRIWPFQTLSIRWVYISSVQCKISLSLNIFFLFKDVFHLVGEGVGKDILARLCQGSSKRQKAFKQELSDSFVQTKLLHEIPRRTRALLPHQFKGSEVLGMTFYAFPNFAHNIMKSKEGDNW